VTALLLVAALAAPPPPILGRDVRIDRPTGGTVVALGGAVRVAARVTGDVVAIAGDIAIVDGGSVSGDVVAVGGRVIGRGPVGGRVVSISAIGGASGGRHVPGRVRAGLALFRAGLWVLAVTALVLLAPRLVRRTGAGLLALGWRAIVVGLGALAVWLVVLVLALAAGAWSVGKLLVLLGIIVFLGAKLVGLSVVAWAVGRGLVVVLPPSLRGEVPRAGVGALVLLACAAIPVAGDALWLAANLVGLGAVAAATLPREGEPRVAFSSSVR
jgi:hypothetical protein